MTRPPIADKAKTRERIEALLASTKLRPAISETGQTVIVSCKTEAEALAVYRVLTDGKISLMKHSRFGCTWIARRDNGIQHLAFSKGEGRTWFG